MERQFILPYNGGILLFLLSSIVGLFTKYKYLLIIIILPFVILAIQDQYNLIYKGNFGKDDPKNFAHILKTIDWAYENSHGDGFKAYNYVPEVYDYPYVYAYWWYGIKKYGYMPAEVSYGPNQPQYVRLSEQFLEKQKGFSGNKIVLTYEKKSTYQEWLKQFSKYCIIKSQDFEWNVGIETRELCR